MSSMKTGRGDSWLQDWELVSRVEWEAEDPRQEPMPLTPPVPLVIFTQTNTRTCGSDWVCTKIVQKLQKRHMETSPDIRYNFLIGGDGRVYEGTGWHSNGVLAAPPSTTNTLGGGVPVTIGELLASAAETAVEVTDQPPAWDQVHGNFITVAFIGDHSDIFPRLKRARHRSYKLPAGHPLQLFTPPDKRITKPYKLSQEVLKWLREYKHVRQDATERWLKNSKWRQFLQKVRENCDQESVAKTELGEE